MGLSLSFIAHQITIYGGTIILIAGVLGGLLNIIVFLSLKTFRQNSCAFYLTIMSMVNIGQLLFGLLSRIMISGFEIDWTLRSLLFCKFRAAGLQFCAFMSYTCLCLAIIDQYFATCTHVRWQQWSNIKVAYRLMIISTFISIIILIPYPIYLNHVTLSTGKIICASTIDFITQFRIYVAPLFLSGYIPDFITVLFGILAYRNVKQIAYRTIPLVRRELDKQLTIMVFVQIVINLLTNIPCVTMNVIVYNTSSLKDPIIVEIIQFIYTITLVMFYTYFASSFYIYMCVSERFRRQMAYVFCEIHLNRWRPPRPFINQVVPS